jgi:CNT family concentrative nucleoside transporter
MALIGQGINGQALITSCMMSIPCSLALSKIRVPETEKPHTTGSEAKIKLDGMDVEANILHAASNGANQGMQVAIIIAAVLLSFISLLKFGDNLLGFFGGLVNVPLSFERITQFLFYPIALVLGVPFTDSFKVAQLLGTKMFVNEFVAYSQLKELIESGALSERSQIVATYVK